MTRQVPATVLADLTRRGLDIGYLDRTDLSPFLSSTGSGGFHFIGAPTDPVANYIQTGKVPSDEVARVALRKVGEQAKAWQTDAAVVAAGTELLRLLDEAS